MNCCTMINDSGWNFVDDDRGPAVPLTLYAGVLSHEYHFYLVSANSQDAQFIHLEKAPAQYKLANEWKGEKLR